VIQTLRTSLTALQRNPTHARIGEVIRRRVEIDPKTKRERVIVIRRGLEVCRKCSVRKECRRLSLALAVEETRKFSGGMNG
jgi:MoaA/NifB/PqqE/SkfB family radical SAM enzyme